MRPRLLVAATAVLALTLLLVAPTMADDAGRFRARLIGYEEVPSISTVASGSFRARVQPGPEIDFELTYSNIQNAVGAHIHLGQKGVIGGVAVPLCGAPKPDCPSTGGTVTGTIVAGDVSLPSQGLATGEIQELIAAMRAGVTYVNVHTSDGDATPNEGPGDFPGGEIRGQVRGSGGD